VPDQKQIQKTYTFQSRKDQGIGTAEKGSPRLCNSRSPSSYSLREASRIARELVVRGAKESVKWGSLS